MGEFAANVAVLAQLDGVAYRRCERHRSVPNEIFLRLSNHICKCIFASSTLRH
jgi:hypothetical protein